ncbi:MAG: Phosphate transport system permease protein PstC [uncultured Thermomicrobiales bacterium]|uniref:Phosphate transport system permease protein n=1 Tax=uncultured Thermomicrobiales bacterium TaxID=1645740 RepID=A0A6J4UYP0_9BACT|nr:MAG: Phosphate transport system permease protein PstC [uncultured Thermomicrobiales bacterium]
MVQVSAGGLNRTPGSPSLDLSGKRNRGMSERVIQLLLSACAVFTMITTVGIGAILAYESIRFFGEVGVTDFLFGNQWTALFPQDQHFGVLPLVRGTLTIALISAFVSIPLGLLAAIYLSEYASEGARAVLKPTLEVLAGVPTIVYGFFALKFITPNLIDPILDVGVFNGLAAGIAIGILTLPLVASLSEDALRAVPRSLREAAYGLGATKLETAVRVILPAAISGVIASFILAISRAIGETMIVALAAGSRPAGQGTGGPWDATQSMQTMTGFIAQAFSGDVSRGTPAFYSLFGVGLLLFLMTLMMNVLSQWIAQRFRQEYE